MNFMNNPKARFNAVINCQNTVYLCCIQYHILVNCCVKFHLSFCKYIDAVLLAHYTVP